MQFSIRLGSKYHLESGGALEAQVNEGVKTFWLKQPWPKHLWLI